MQTLQNQAILFGGAHPATLVTYCNSVASNIYGNVNLRIRNLSFSTLPHLRQKGKIYQTSGNVSRMGLSSLVVAPIQRFGSQCFAAYKSQGSFHLDKSAGVVVRSLLRPQSRVQIQVSHRSFKTIRNQQAEESRNPNLFTRLKLRLFPQLKTSKMAGAQSSDKFNAMLSSLPPEEANKMKIAFAEGYIAANPAGQEGEPKGKAYRYRRTLQQLLMIAVLTSLLFMLLGSLGGGGMFRVNVVGGNQVLPEEINVTFDDVKGVTEAKAELQEIVEFLKNPDKFVALGGKLPKGVLLVGPPGTGKTLLARAVAGEASVPFFHAAGPEFDEILVGQGARRVRDLFKAAKAKAPCVIFIDEIDSVGAKRTNSVLHPYANQTINQLLSEMDGFRQNEGVIVLGATNRRDDLDKALLRPGRFDVEVHVHAPDLSERVEILEYYLTKVKRGVDVDIEQLARGTTGFTGADIENMVNQAALRAAVEGAHSVDMRHIDFARDKVIMGPERKSRIPDEEANLITAYHEAGHALVNYYTKGSYPLHKITIIPRRSMGSLGHTSFMPEKERYHTTKSQLLAEMDTAMGGRAAEELIFGIERITSGAYSDLKSATALAKHMVKECGMSEKAGLRTVNENSDMYSANDLSNETVSIIDAEVKRLLQESYDRAKKILIQHAKEHKALAEALLKYETLDSEDVKGLLTDGTAPNKPMMYRPGPSPVAPSPTHDHPSAPRVTVGPAKPKIPC